MLENGKTPSFSSEIRRFRHPKNPFAADFCDFIIIIEARNTNPQIPGLLLKNTRFLSSFSGFNVSSFGYSRDGPLFKL
jgi:hypothetical protein